MKNFFRVALSLGVLAGLVLLERSARCGESANPNFAAMAATWSLPR